ncbi:MAG: hypothetical protein GY820_06075 [Gammaproteobacteria bacterium]|nr:hypothetical protein [Gammaproteobacteria bacterium]
MPTTSDTKSGSGRFDFKHHRPDRMDGMYAEDDIEQCPVFGGRTGSYVNFGKWNKRKNDKGGAVEY